MKKILFFSNIFSLAIILSACGSSGTPQAQGEGADEEIHITNPLNNVSETERTITLVPDKEPRTSAQTAVSGSTPSGSTVTFGEGTFIANSAWGIYICGINYSDVPWCGPGTTNPNHGSESDRDFQRRGLFNASGKINTVQFLARKENLNHGNATEYKVAESGDITFTTGDSDALIEKFRQIYQDKSSDDLEFPINFNYKFSADNVDVNASQIDTACFKEDFAANNVLINSGKAFKIGRDESLSGGSPLSNFSPILIIGSGHIIGLQKLIDNSKTSTLEFRFTPQLDCIESTSKFDVTYEIDVDSAPGGDVDITVTADLGEVTFAPILVEFVTIRGDLLGSTKVEAPNTFGTDKKIIKVGVEACSDGRCIGPFDESIDQNVGLEQETTNIKTALLGLVFRQGTQGATVKRDGAIGVYRRAVERITSNTSSNDYKCGTYSLDPIGEGNLEVTHVGTDGDNETYKISLDFVSTANPCSRELVYIHENGYTKYEKTFEDLKGRAFDFPKIKNKICYRGLTERKFVKDEDNNTIRTEPVVEDYCEYQKVGSDLLLPASEYKTIGNDLLLEKEETHLLSFADYSAETAIIPQSDDGTGNALFVIDQTKGNQVEGIEFKVLNNFDNIDRDDVLIRISKLKDEWDDRSQTYHLTVMTNRTLERNGIGSHKRHKYVASFTNRFGEVQTKSFSLDKDTRGTGLDNIHAGCLSVYFEEQNGDVIEDFIRKKPWFVEYNCKSGSATGSERLTTESTVSLVSDFFGTVSVSSVKATPNSGSVETIDIMETTDYTGYNFTLSGLHRDTESTRISTTHDTAKEYFKTINQDVVNDLRFVAIQIQLKRSFIGVNSVFTVTKSGIAIDNIELVNVTFERDEHNAIVETTGSVIREGGTSIQSGVPFTLETSKVESMVFECINNSTGFVVACSEIMNTHTASPNIGGDKPGSELTVNIDFKGRFTIAGPLKLEKTGSFGYKLIVRYEERYILRTDISLPNGDSIDEVSFLNEDGTLYYEGGMHQTDDKDLGSDIIVPTDIICFEGDISKKDSATSDCNEFSAGAPGVSIVTNDERTVITSTPRAETSNVQYYAIGDKIYVTYDFTCRLTVNLVFSNTTENLPAQDTDCSRADVNITYPLGDNYNLTDKSVIDETVIESIEGGVITGNKFDDNSYSVTINFKPNVVPVNTSQVSVGEDAVISGNIPLEFFLVKFQKKKGILKSHFRGTLETEEEIYLPFPKSGTVTPLVERYVQNGESITEEKLLPFFNISESKVSSEGSDGMQIKFTLSQAESVSGNGIVSDSQILVSATVSRSYSTEIRDEVNELVIPVRYTLEEVIRKAYIFVPRKDGTDDFISFAHTIVLNTTSLSNPFKASQSLVLGDTNNPGDINLHKRLTDSGLRVSVSGEKAFYNCSIEICVIVNFPSYSIYKDPSSVEIVDEGTNLNLEDIWLKFEYKVKINSFFILNGVSSNQSLNFNVGLDGGPKYKEYLNPKEVLRRIVDRDTDKVVLSGLFLNEVDIGVYTGLFASSHIDSETITNNFDEAFNEEYLEWRHTYVMFSNNEAVAGSHVSSIVFDTPETIFQDDSILYPVIYLVNPTLPRTVGVRVDSNTSREQYFIGGIRGNLIGVEFVLIDEVMSDSERCRSRVQNNYSAIMKCVSDFTNGEIIFEGNFTMAGTQAFSFGAAENPETYILKSVSVDSFEFNTTDEYEYEADGFRVTLNFDRVFFTRVNLNIRNSTKPAGEEFKKLVSSPASIGEPYIGSVEIFRNSEDKTNLYISEFTIHNSHGNTGSGNSKRSTYVVNSTLDMTSFEGNIKYSSYEIERDGQSLHLIIKLVSNIDSSGWVKYIKVFEKGLAERFGTASNDRARESSNLLLRNERGGFNFHQSVCNDQKKVEVRDDKEHAFWTLCNQLLEIKKNIAPSKQYSVNVTPVHTGNSSLDKTSNLETGINNYLLNTDSYQDNRTFALLFQDRYIIDVIRREGRLSDSVVIIPVAEDSRRRETNEIPCPFSYVESCRQLDREDRIVFVQGVIKITDEHERYELNATNADDEGYYKYSKSGCSGIDKCFSVSVNWESVNNLPPHNGVASVYYAYLIFILSNYWDIDKWQANRILQTVAEPLTPYKGVAESSWGPGILSLESLIDEVTLNPITRDEVLRLIQ